METERSYVASLDTLISVYVKPLEESANDPKKGNRVLTPAQISGIFSNISVIAELNRTFADELIARLEDW